MKKSLKSKLYFKDNLVVYCVIALFAWISKLMEDNRTATLGCPCPQPIGRYESN